MNLSRFVIAGLLVALAATTAYGYRTRAVAMNAWTEYGNLQASMAGSINATQKAIEATGERTRAEVDQSNKRLYETAVRADAGLPLTGALDPATADAAVRDFIHRTNIVGSNRPIGKYPAKVYSGIGTEEGALLCGGMAIAHAWAMNTLGIPARTVELGGQNFLSGKDRKQTHAFAEVFYDGDWHISDPTFNISVDCSDGEKHISAKEAFACLEREETLVGVQGRNTVPGRSLADLRAKYSSYFAAYELAASPISKREMHPSDAWIREALAKYGITSIR